MAQEQRTLEPADETYFVSLNDMMIGLVFLFIIILMAFALNFRNAEQVADRTMDELRVERDALARERDELAQERDTLIEQRDRLETLTARLIDKDAVRERLLLEIQRRLAQRGVEVVVEPEKGILHLPESLLFASGEAELSRDGQKALAVLAEVLAGIVPCYAAVGARAACDPGILPILETVLIEGHTDDAPLRGGRFQDNWNLSVARGVNTFKTLIELSPELDALENDKHEKLLGVAGYESRRPVVVGSDAQARRANRRIDLRFVVSAPSGGELTDLDARLGDVLR